jgi:hypothetical protein
MKHNSLFAVAAALVAGAAIGGGAIVSQQAMATRTPAKATDSVTIGMLGADGTAVQCTFTGADAQDLIPAGAPTDSTPLVAPEGGSGIITQVTGAAVPPPELDSSNGVVTASVDAATGAMEVVGAGEWTAREGTPEECADLRAAMVGAIASGESLEVTPEGSAPFITGVTGATGVEVEGVTP